MTLELVEPHKRLCAYHRRTCQQAWRQSPTARTLSQVSAASAGLLSHSSHSLRWTSVPLSCSLYPQVHVLFRLFVHTCIMNLTHSFTPSGDVRVLSPCPGVACFSGAYKPFIKLSLVFLPIVVPVFLSLVPVPRRFSACSWLRVSLSLSLGLGIHRSHKEVSLGSVCYLMFIRLLE